MENDRDYTPWAARPRYGTKYADPATDAARFKVACEEADAWKVKTGYETIVFKNSWGFYFTREAKWSWNIEALYTTEGK